MVRIQHPPEERKTIADFDRHLVEIADVNPHIELPEPSPMKESESKGVWLPQSMIGGQGQVFRPPGGRPAPKVDLEEEDFDQFDDDLDMEERKDMNFIESGLNQMAHFGIDQQGKNKKEKGFGELSRI